MRQNILEPRQSKITVVLIDNYLKVDCLYNWASPLYMRSGLLK